jgi:hypothetical protein
MPLREYQCENVDCEEYGIRLERIVSVHQDYRDELCEGCALPLEPIFPLVSVQPDNMWAGTNTNLGYVTSKSDYNRMMKERNLEPTSKYDREVMRRRIPSIQAEKRAKADTQIEKCIHETLRDVEFPDAG